MPTSALDPRERPGFQEWMATQQEQKAAVEAELERMAIMPPLENPRIFYEPEQRPLRLLEFLKK